jgi:glycosyltransferase involved in cell wall biosynthesis
MTKILLITNLYPNAQEPNRGVFVAQLVRELRRYAELTVVSPLPYFPGWGPLRRLTRWHPFSQVPFQETRDGIPVYYPKYVMTPRLFGGLQSVYMAVRLYPLIRALHRKNRYDLFHAEWMFPDGVAAAWIADRLGVPTVLAALGCDINRDTKQPLLRYQIRWALQKAGSVVAVSHPLAEAMESLRVAGLRIRTIVNGVDTERFRPRDRLESRRRLGLDPDAKIVLFVGEMVEVKGIPTLLRAAAALRDRPGWRVMLVGEGGERAAYEAESERLGVSDRVSFLGARKHEEIPLWMSAADLLCLPSLREGTPNVVLEALASGLPVVATRVGELLYLVSEANGRLVPVGDADALAAALRAVLEKRWDPAAVRKTVQDRTWSSVAGEYWDEFRRVMKG